MVLDGWSYTEPEEGFDTLQAEVIAASDAYLPQKNDDVATEFGFSTAIVIERGDVTEEGNLYKAKIKAKGIKTDAGYKVRSGASAQIVQGIRSTRIGTSEPPIYSEQPFQSIRYNPWISVAYVATGTATVAIGDVVTPPVIPVAPQSTGTGTLLNDPFGWVVEDIQSEGIGGTYSSPQPIAWAHQIRYQWTPEFANGEVL